MPTLTKRTAPISTATQPANHRLAELDRLANLLDSRWGIPGTPMRFGVDALVGLVPGIGDAAAGAVSLYIISQAAKHGAPRPLIGRMVANTAVDFVVGSVPLLGSVFDLFFKANKRNMSLLREHFETTPASP